jgi:hypothetical protein
MSWFRFRGMIKPGMALTWADASYIHARRGIWMVEYLRSRRLKDGMTGYFRRKHFNEPPVR